jgi:aminoglycoside 2''-phosphotransferase
MSVAVLVNEEWVFRFPKTQEGAKDLEKEIRILPHLAKHVTLAIPQFAYIGKRKNGMPFVGYRMLPGEILGEDAVPTLSEHEQELIAGQLARFIDEMSSFSVEMARELGIPEVDFRREYAETFAEVKQKVFPLMDQNMRRYISDRFAAYLGNPENFQYTPALLHADLSPDHFLIDQIERKLTGIIDFGDIMIGDPDFEYIYILEDGGVDFARRVMERRGQDPEKHLPKAAFFVTADYLRFILEGVTSGDQQWVNEGIASIRDEMR